MLSRPVRRLLDVGVSALIVAVALFPILWGFLSSFKPSAEIVSFPPRLFPTTFTFEHYRAIYDTGILHYLLNSFLVSAGTVALCLACGTVGAYALARFSFRGKTLVTLVIIMVMSIPIPSLLIPTFTWISDLGLINTRLALVLVYTAYQLPFVVWILATYYQSLPEELEWSAAIDGYGRLATLWKVVLPLSWPGMVAATLFVITFAWNDFVVAVVLLSSEETRTLPIGIYNYLGFYGRDWGPLLAAAMVSIVPLLAIFVVLQRYFVAGMTGGGVKG